MHGIQAKPEALRFQLNVWMSVINVSTENKDEFEGSHHSLG